MMSDIENLTLGADEISALKNANKGDLITKRIDFSRKLSEYPNAHFIANAMVSKGKERKHIYTKDLNVNGVAVADNMENYLEKNALQSSHLKQALLSPLHFYFSLDEDKKEIEKLKGRKNYFELGTFLHQCILEPTKFSRVIVEPKLSLTTKEGVSGLIDFWEKIIEKQEYGYDENKEKISPEQSKKLAIKRVDEVGLKIEKQDGKKIYYYALKEIAGIEAVSEEHFLKIQILKKHYDNYGGGILKDLLRYSKREISFYSEYDGMDLKVRPDAIQFEENIGVNAIISIKSTACEDLRAFYYNAAKLNYDLSEGMYQEVVSQVTGRDFNTTIMIMLQTVAPFGIAVLVWNGEDIEVGKSKFHTSLQIAKDCISKDTYKGYDAFSDDNFGLIDMKLPSWNNSEILPTLL